MSKTVAIYGGGFKPPQKGHLKVVQEFLKGNSNLDEFIIYVGGKPRDGITQEDSIKVWDIYSKHLKGKISIKPSKAPIGDIVRFIKNNPDTQIYWVLGAREGNDEDREDIDSRTKRVKEKYPHLTIKVITTSDGNVSGTNARKALKQSQEEFKKYTPNFLSNVEEDEIWNILSSNIENLNENSTQPSINYLKAIEELTVEILNKYPHIKNVPKLSLIHNDLENASKLLGKTAFYDPNTKTITLYTQDRHPKDIIRSYTHELQHYIQDEEGRLEGIHTDNVNEDDKLLDLEKEAYLEGNINFRTWEDGVKEQFRGNLRQDPFGLVEFSLSLADDLGKELLKSKPVKIKNK